MAIPIAPNIAGFKDAMRRGRQQLGTSVDFRVRQTPVWPSGTQLGPDGTPYDPSIEPVSGGGYDVVTKTVGVIIKDASKLRPGTDSRFEPGGEFSGMDMILDLDAADYADVQNATRVGVFGRNFQIEEWKPDGMVDAAADRFLVYCQEL